MTWPPCESGWGQSPGVVGECGRLPRVAAPEAAKEAAVSAEAAAIVSSCVAEEQ